MICKYLPPALITSEEAVKIFEFATISEMRIVEKLVTEYRKKYGVYRDLRWDTLKVFSFIYVTGRIQGIREERAKRKA